MLCKINHLGRHLDTCRQPLPFHRDYSFSSTSTQCNPGRGCASTLAELKPIVSGAGSSQLLLFLCLPQRQPRVLFMTVLFHASWSGIQRGKVGRRVARLEVEAAVASARFLGSLLSSTHAGFLSCTPFLPLSFSPPFQLFSLSVRLCHCLFILHAFSRAFPRFVGQNKRQAVSRERKERAKGRLGVKKAKQSKARHCLWLFSIIS